MDCVFRRFLSSIYYQVREGTLTRDIQAYLIFRTHPGKSGIPHIRLLSMANISAAGSLPYLCTKKLWLNFMWCKYGSGTFLINYGHV